MEQTKADATKDGVVVPETVEEYCIKQAPKVHDEAVDMIDLDDDFYDYGADDSGKHQISNFESSASQKFTFWALA